VWFKIDIANKIGDGLVNFTVAKCNITFQAGTRVAQLTGA